MERNLVCRQCGASFVFSESEQALYMEKGFTREPQRCEACRMSKKALESAEKPKKEMYPAICAACGCQTELPFRPTGDKPVYCYACLLSRKGKESD
ncbi:MAG: zinc-ribbon domain containing protein [Clostridia bacterium]|nr:zinc-ribbon domain containing protein [Clostridia bacterium]